MLSHGRKTDAFEVTVSADPQTNIAKVVARHSVSGALEGESFDVLTEPEETGSLRS